MSTMADALIGFVIEELASLLLDNLKEQVGFVAGAREEVKKLDATFKKIQAVLEDAENRQIKDKTVKMWLEELKDAAYEIEDVLDEWKTRILISQVDGSANTEHKVFSYFKYLCPCFTKVTLHRDIGLKIKNLRENLDIIASEKDKFNLHSTSKSEESITRPDTSSLVDSSGIYGREVDKNIILSKLSGSSQDHAKVHVISIVGMGGFGKTTLAQLIFNDAVATSHFDKKVWVCVSDPFDMNKLAAKIIEGLGDTIHATTVTQWETLHHQLCKSLKDKKIFLVLDDVWLEHKETWEKIKLALDQCLIGSRVLITTRSEDVSITVGSVYKHNLGSLNDEDCWELFSRHAFNGKWENDRHRLENIGRKISFKCKGVPLFVKTLGCLMPYKKTVRDWQDVLDSDLWESEKVNKDILPAFMLSYIALPLQLRRCFAYCVVFAKNYSFKKDELVKLWMSQGFIFSSSSRDMEIIGEEYFDDLVSRSFFQDLRNNENGKVTCKIHDLVHDFANFVSNNECSIVEGISTEYNSAKTRHLTFRISDDESHLILPSIQNARRLRTLLFWVDHSGPQLDISMLYQLKCLRTLNLYGVAIETLPNEIGDLIHLRYLDLSGTELVELPETISDLINLQTLKLNHCEVLCQLPQGLGKLINLRHLEIDSTPNLKCLPRGLEGLKHLQTLSTFVMSEEGCQLRELRDLNKLNGKLLIQNIKGTSQEADDAKLKNKPYLCQLGLFFRDEHYEGKSDQDASVLELLQPHPNLENLCIRAYGGSKFPTWMELLTSLEYLELGGLDLISPLALFNGLEASASVAYPNLKTLRITSMNHWEEWEMETEGDTTTIMPSLQILGIKYCPKLKSLPRQILSDSLMQLQIWGCPELTISYLPPFLEVLNLWEDTGSLSRSLPFVNNTTLKLLGITQSPHSSLPRGISQLKALRILEIQHCSSLTCIVEDIQLLTSLELLYIWRCPILKVDWSILSHIRQIFFEGVRIK